MLKKLQNKKGFTLMEMLIVVAIIAVLVAIAIPVFNGALTKSKEAADVANVRATYAEWQTAILTENKTAPDSKDNFLKGPDNGTAIVLNYGDDKLAYDAGTGTITHLQCYQADRREWCKDLHLDSGYARYSLISSCHIHTQQLPHRPGRAGAGRPVSHRAGMAVGWRPSPLRESSPI